MWSDSGDNIEHTFMKDQLLSNVMIYLVTGTVATSVWFYRGSAFAEIPLQLWLVIMGVNNHRWHEQAANAGA